MKTTIGWMPFPRRNLHPGNSPSIFQALPRPPSQDPPEVATHGTHRMPFPRRNLHPGNSPSIFQALPRPPSQDPSEVATLRTHRTTIPRRNLHPGNSPSIFQALPRPPSQGPPEVAILRMHIGACCWCSCATCRGGRRCRLGEGSRSASFLWCEGARSLRSWHGEPA